MSLTSVNAAKSHESDSLTVLLTQVPNGAFTYLVSHNWESADHPDNDEGTKLRWLKNMKAHLRIHSSHEMWIWFDVFSIPRKDRRGANQGDLVASRTTRSSARGSSRSSATRAGGKSCTANQPSQLITGMACGGHPHLLPAGMVPTRDQALSNACMLHA